MVYNGVNKTSKYGFYCLDTVVKYLTVSEIMYCGEITEI